MSGMNIGERIAARLEALGGRSEGFSQAWLARETGLSQPTINALIKKPERGSKHLHTIAGKLGTTVAYLVGETDDPFSEASVIPSIASMADRLNLALIPHLEIGYSMGGGSVFEDYHHVGFRTFDRDWLRSITLGSFESLFVARGEGDSMHPTLMDEDMVIVDTSQRFIKQQDRIWAISYGELGMIKRVRRTPKGTYLIMSDNPVVSVIEAVDEEMHVVGRVIWIGRKM
jgi:phage repressor protein C with HTH and peptisase S24 domain